MNINLRQLKAFSQVARLRSFTRAAESMHMTQAGLSSMVKDLEAQLDCRLFDRTTRKVELTAAGEQLLMAAAHVIDALEGTASVISRLEAEARLSLTVAATPLVASTLMPEACKVFKTLYPDVVVRIMDLDRDRIQASVDAGVVDIGFGIFLDDAAGISRTELYRCHLMFLQSIEARTTQIHGEGSNGIRHTYSWKRLNQATLLGLPVENPVQQLVDAHLSQFHEPNKHRLEFFNFHTLLAMVQADMGAAILPSFILAAVRPKDMDIRLLTEPLVPVDFYAISKKGRVEAPHQLAFATCLRGVMSNLCDLGPLADL